MTRLTIAAACVALFAVSAKAAKDEKMTLEIYYDSDCKASQRLFDEEIGRLLAGPCYDVIRPIYIPYANVQETQLPGKQSYNYTCQHGPNECKKNKLQMCTLQATHKLPSREQADVLMCLQQPHHGCHHHRDHHHHHHHHHHRRALRQEWEPSHEGEEFQATDDPVLLLPSVKEFDYSENFPPTSAAISSSPAQSPHPAQHSEQPKHKKAHHDESPASKALHHCLHRQRDLLPEIQACMNGTQGDEMMHAAAEKVKALGNKPYAPFIRINSKVLPPSAFDDLKQALCDASGKKCEECCAPPPWFVRFWRAIVDFFVFVFHGFHGPPPRPSISEDLCLLHPNKTMTHTMTIVERIGNQEVILKAIA